MKIISQDYLPVRTFILIGMVLLTTTQTYAQNINTRLSFTLKNATLKEFVKLIENSTGYSFIYGEEVGIRHKITLKAKEMPLHEVLDTVFKDELISYQFSGRYILLKEKKGQKPVSRKFTISGYVTDGTSSERLQPFGICLRDCLSYSTQFSIILRNLSVVHCFQDFLLDFY